MNLLSIPHDELSLAAGGKPPSSFIANPSVPKGWTWACDAEGRFTICSPEVKDVLNISAEEFYGKPLASYALAPRSAKLVHSMLNQDQLPVEIYVNYQNRNGDLIPVSLYIAPTLSDEGHLIGTHGFVQNLLIDGNIQIPHETPTADQIQLGSTIILETLSEVRKRSPDVNSFALSSITMSERLINPKSRFQKILNGTYAGEKVHASLSGYKVREIEHKLTWGDKYDLDLDENLYIQRNKFRRPGWRGFIQRLLAPASIVQHDLRWFAVVLQIEEEGAIIWFNYPHGKDVERKITLSDLISNPNLILSKVARAIQYPWRTTSIYARGVDYLRNPQA
ncbi:MAG: PAS domain-containing protein [Anaerolineales bacterium]|jgi:hypothetical protein